MRLAHVCILGLALAGAAVAQIAPPDEGARTIAFELREGDTLVAAPTVRVEFGRPTALAVGGYSLRLRMVRAAPAEGYVIRSSLYRSDGGWQLVASPILTVTEARQGHARFAAGDGRELSLAASVR